MPKVGEVEYDLPEGREDAGTLIRLGERAAASSARSYVDSVAPSRRALDLFRSLSPPRSPIGNPISLLRKILNENNGLKLPTKTPEVNRFGESRPGETGFRRNWHRRSGDPAGITLENSKKFRLREQADIGFCREVGGGTGTGIEQSLGLKPLILHDAIPSPWQLRADDAPGPAVATINGRRRRAAVTTISVPTNPT
jgi:hypothetical protein